MSYDWRGFIKEFKGYSRQERIDWRIEGEWSRLEKIFLKSRKNEVGWKGLIKGQDQIEVGQRGFVRKSGVGWKGLLGGKEQLTRLERIDWRIIGMVYVGKD